MTGSGIHQELQHCFDAAYRYLSYRSRSESEIRIYLHRCGYDDHSIESVLLKLKEQGVVDDTTFAQSWKENRESFSPRSCALLRLELKRKGVDPDIITEIVGEIDEESSAYRAAQKKAKVLTMSDYPSFQRKLGTYLRRRGFNYEVTQQAIRRLWQEREEQNA